MLSKKYRLAKERDFQGVFKKGKTFAERFVVVKFSANELDFSRFGFAVSLKVSKKAVERNKIRRQLQEIIGNSYGKIESGRDVVIIARPEIKVKDYQEIEKVLKGALQKAGILKK